MSTSINVINTLGDARDEGNLSQASLTALTNIRDIGAEIQNGLGIPVDQVGASEVILLSLLVDDSGSMEPNVQAVIDGFNMLKDALEDSKQQDNIQVMVRYINKGVIIPFTPLSALPRLSSFSTDGITPLYRESITTLGTTITKVQDFENNGIQVRSITLIMTDGGDNASGGTTDSDVQKIVTDMIQAEKHIVAGMGFSAGYGPDFRLIFKNMGLQDNWVLTAQATPSEIRKAFKTFSQSVARASQSAAQFSATALGGFGS